MALRPFCVFFDSWTGLAFCPMLTGCSCFFFVDVPTSHVYHFPSPQPERPHSIAPTLLSTTVLWLISLLSGIFCPSLACPSSPLVPFMQSCSISVLPLHGDQPGIFFFHFLHLCYWYLEPQELDGLPKALSDKGKQAKHSTALLGDFVLAIARLRMTRRFLPLVTGTGFRDA